MANKDLVECNRLRASEVGKTEAQHAAAETHTDRIAQREVFGIDGLATVGDGGGVSPTGHPFIIVFHHIKSDSIVLDYNLVVD
jgi:hypothetical protein